MDSRHILKPFIYLFILIFNTFSFLFSVGGGSLFNHSVQHLHEFELIVKEKKKEVLKHNEN